MSGGSSRGPRADDRGAVVGGRARRRTGCRLSLDACTPGHAGVRRFLADLPSTARAFVPPRRRSAAGVRAVLWLVRVRRARGRDGVEYGAAPAGNDVARPPSARRGADGAHVGPRVRGSRGVLECKSRARLVPARFAAGWFVVQMVRNDFPLNGHQIHERGTEGPLPLNLRRSAWSCWWGAPGRGWPLWFRPGQKGIPSSPPPRSFYRNWVPGPISLLNFQTLGGLGQFPCPRGLQGFLPATPTPNGWGTFPLK